MLVAYRIGHRAVFLYGFAKRERENIDEDELLTLREIGAAWLAADSGRIAEAIEEGALQEVIDDDVGRQPSRLTKALLETADDMRRVGILDAAAHEKITLRHLATSQPPSPSRSPARRSARSESASI